MFGEELVEICLDKLFAVLFIIISLLFKEHHLKVFNIAVKSYDFILLILYRLGFFIVLYMANKYVR